ncbi:MAG: flavodoxin family protein [Synergistaceae bacterium]|nr:flavodoxin family protein [Synergistaceae bacterium]
MKVIAINGSPRPDGNTAIALGAMAEILKQEGIETELVQVGGQLIHDCIGCGYCKSSERNLCVFKGDLVEETSLKMREADGIILGAPTYYAGVPGDMKAFLDRVFFSNMRYFKYKVGTVVAAVRRGGGVDVVHQLMNYFSLSETITPPSQYWTIVYGLAKGEALRDIEGMQTVRKNARAMAWLLKVVDASKGKVPLPPEEDHEFMHFIR